MRRNNPIRRPSYALSSSRIRRLDLLRNALRLNGLAVLNQECKDFMLDVAPVKVGGKQRRTRRKKTAPAPVPLSTRRPAF